MPFACLRVKILRAIGSDCRRHVDSVVVSDSCLGGQIRDQMGALWLRVPKSAVDEEWWDVLLKRW